MRIFAYVAFRALLRAAFESKLRRTCLGAPRAKGMSGTVRPVRSNGAEYRRIDLRKRAP